MSTDRYHALAECERCPLRGQESYVPSSLGTGPVAVVGEAPGWQEVRAGAPFVGRSGAKLRQLIDQAGVDLDEASVMNTVCCLPARGDAVPIQAIKCCSERLRSELEGVEQVLALGRVASRGVVGRFLKITESPHIERDQWEGRRTVVAPHPAAILRGNTALEPRLLAGIQRLGQVDVSVTWEWPRYDYATSEAEALTALAAWTDPATGDDPVTVDVETVGSRKWERYNVERLRMVGLGRRSSDGYRILTIGECALEHASVRSTLAQMLVHRGIVAHHAMSDVPVLRWREVASRLTGDTMLAAIPLDETPGGKSLEALCARYPGLPRWKPVGADKASWYATCSEPELAYYNAQDVTATLVLEDYERGVGAWTHPLTGLLIPASTMLTNVHRRGMAVDDEALARVLSRYEEATERLHREVVTAFSGCLDHDVNPNAPHQVVAALAAVGIHTKDTRKETVRALIESAGTPVTDDEGKSSLEIEAIEATLVGCTSEPERSLLTLLAYRWWSKRMSTYLKPLAERQTSDRRVHGELNLHTSLTRLSGARPNMQNWPRAGGAREVFWAGPGRVFAKQDMSQAELRVIAVEVYQLTGDRSLLDVCIGGDLHAETANAVGITRVQAKTINFGIPYGRTEHGLIKGLNLPEQQSRQIVAAYFARFPGILEWQAEIRRKAQEDEALTTVFGRCFRPANVEMLDERQREEALRTLLSCIPQAVSSDINLTAAILADQRGVEVVNLVHDEVRAECDVGDEQEVLKILADCMLEASARYTDLIQFPVEQKVTTHWTD